MLCSCHFLPDRNEELAIIKQTTGDKQVEIQPVMDAERIGQIGELVSPGQMVPEFDQVVFSVEVNQVTRVCKDPVWLSPDRDHQPYREINAGGSRSAGLSPVSVSTIPIRAGAGL